MSLFQTARLKRWAGLDDKRQITVLLSYSMKGKLLPTQVIYGGKTPVCLPKVASPKDCYLSYTENHWSNEETMMAYFVKHFAALCN